MLETQYDGERNTLTCRFTGRLDSLASENVGPDLDRHIQSARSAAPAGHPQELAVVFDLARVDYVASAFLRICLSVAKSLGAGQMSVVNCQPTVKKVFAIAGMDRVMPVG